MVFSVSFTPEQEQIVLDDFGTVEAVEGWLREQLVERAVAAQQTRLALAAVEQQRTARDELRRTLAPTQEA